jgi:hypothetical protein
MSAYMVADETINRVVDWLSIEVMKSQWLRDKLELVSGIATTNSAWVEVLGKAMFALNMARVTARYGEGEAGKFRQLNYHYVPSHPTTRYSERSQKIQVLKSLQCWLYQCLEGDVVKKPLYQFFRDTVEPHLMSSIISDLPEYQAAAWG